MSIYLESIFMLYVGKQSVYKFQNGASIFPLGRASVCNQNVWIKPPLICAFHIFSMHKLFTAVANIKCYHVVYISELGICIHPRLCSCPPDLDPTLTRPWCWGVDPGADVWGTDGRGAGPGACHLDRRGTNNRGSAGRQGNHPVSRDTVCAAEISGKASWDTQHKT